MWRQWISNGRIHRFMMPFGDVPIPLSISLFMMQLWVHADTIKILLEAKANVDAVDKVPSTSLHYAASTRGVQK